MDDGREFTLYRMSVIILTHSVESTIFSMVTFQVGRGRAEEWDNSGMEKITRRRGLWVV